MNSTILELREKLDTNKVTKEELVKETISNSKKYNEKYNAFVTIIEDPKISDIDNTLLSGIPYAAKDNYSTKGILTTGSSNTLKNYVPFFNATVIEKLNNAGAILTSKTALDEFGLGGSGITAHTGVQKNPWDINRISGGSSSGSAVAVSLGIYPFALGSDTGDSIRKPAAYNGIVGYKPTYGMISRYGLFPFASSLDTCGVLTRSVKDAAIVVDAIKGKDSKDLTSIASSDINLLESLNGNIDGKKLCYIKELTDINNYNNKSEELVKHLENFHNTLDILRNNNIVVEEISIDRKILDIISSVYAVISRAEATSNLSNLTGISFGDRGEGKNIVEMMKDHRTKGFSSLIKRRLVIGSYILQKENQERYFINAKRARRLIVNIMNDYFKKYDALIMPVGSGIAPYIKDVNDDFNFDELTALENHLQIGNFGGYPSITIPNGFVNNMPVGINITGKVKDDANVLNIAYFLENNMNYKNQIARGCEDEI